MTKARLAGLFSFSAKGNKKGSRFIGFLSRTGMFGN
jgi:hypothetical protein